MRAIAITPEKPGARLVERQEPRIERPDQIKIKVAAVGICGTDREEVEGGRSLAPKNSSELVIGHEMFGRVVDVGDKVRLVKPGDHGLFTVRRGCGKCTPCGLNRPDMCRTGDFVERGIWGLDGYQTEFVVDDEAWFVAVPEPIKELGVLAEPLSVVEKAIDEAVRIQRLRLPGAGAAPNWLAGRRCLVAGLGPIGMLAALILRLQGAEVYGLDVVPPDSARPRWFENVGCCYLNGKQVPPDAIEKEAGPMDLIVEATGVGSLMFNLLAALARDGIAALTGIPAGDRCADIPVAQLGREVVLDNRIMIGSVNAARDHFQMGINHLALAHLRWGDLVGQIITHRYQVDDYGKALGAKPADEIKAVLEWA